MLLMESSPENCGVTLSCSRDTPSGAAERVSDKGETRRSVTQWTVPEVCSWLSNRSWGAQGGPLLEAASSHAISGKVLLRLTDETLVRMGIVPRSLRQELLHEVLCLRLQQEMEDLLDITDGEERLAPPGREGGKPLHWLERQQPRLLSVRTTGVNPGWRPGVLDWDV